MRAPALSLLRCPRTGSPLRLEAEEREGDDVLTGALISEDGRERYPIRKGIPRFVPSESYASSFGFEWDLFGDLQVDRMHGHSLTRDRFFTEAGCGAGDLQGRRVLEVGCGGGRFSDVILQAGAELFAIDLSSAVEKNRELHPRQARLHLAQASLTGIPFAPEAFDLVFCFGVLQHTPDPAVSFRALVPFVKPGGRLAVDIYAAHLKQVLHWKYLVRPLTKRMDRGRLLRLIDRAVPTFLPLSRQVRRIPVVGKPLSRFIPICVHDGFMGRVSGDEERRWAILETLDALSPQYDRPRSRRALRHWFEAAGFVEVAALNMNHALNYGRGIKPASSLGA